MKHIFITVIVLLFCCQPAFGWTTRGDISYRSQEQITTTNRTTNSPTPSSGYGTFFAKDKTPYFIDSDGNVDDLSSGGSGDITAVGTCTTGACTDDFIDGTDIGDDKLDSEHYVAGSIDAEHLASDIIDETKIADDGIDSEHYNDASIDAAHLAADIIDETKIADDGVDSEHYNDGSIDEVHLDVANSPTDEYCFTYEADTGNFQWVDCTGWGGDITTVGTCTTGACTDDFIDGTDIGNDKLDSEHYVAGSIDAEHLAADIIDETKIADNGVDSEHYNDGSIDLVHLDSAVYAKDIVTTAPITGATDNVLVGADSDVTIAITLEKDLVTTAPLTGGTDDILPGSDSDVTLAVTVEKDIVTTAPITGGTDDVIIGSDADITIALTQLKDIVTTSPLTGGENDVLPGADADLTLDVTVAKDIVATSPLTVNAGASLDDIIIGTDADITIAIADADDDGSTKGAAAFNNDHFDAAGGIVSLAQAIYPKAISKTANYTLKITETYNAVVYVANASTITVPAVQDAVTVGFPQLFTVVVTTADTVIVDVDGSDIINLDGVDLSAGDSIDSDGTIWEEANFLAAPDQIHWLVKTDNNTWVDGN